MKYIRTKDWDGIWEVVEETDLVYRVKARGEPHHVYSKSKCQTQVIAQSDTIEELCDEFVFIDIGVFRTNRYIYKSLREAESKDFLYDKCYGAIWTEKGLIYVAKMNDKGEMELL